MHCLVRHSKVLMIKLLWRTDIHDSDQTPGSRTDNWPDTVGGKIRQVGQIAKDQGCVAVLDGGDYFNNKFPMRTSHKLVNRIASLHDQYPCEVWANVGNHDCRQSQIDNLAEGPLGVLFAAGVFRRCYDEHEAVFTDYARKVRVVGIPYHGPFYDMDRFKIEKGDEDYLVCMAHVLASASGGTMFKSEDIIKYDQLLELAPDVDVWCFGHWHKDQGITEIAPNKWVVNIGSLTRGTLAQDDIERHPSVACLTFGGNGMGGKISIEKIPLEIQDAKSVFDLTKRTKEEAREMVVDAFVESVQKDLQNKSDKPFSEIVSGMKNVPHKVRERALEFIEKATVSVK